MTGNKTIQLKNGKTVEVVPVYLEPEDLQPEYFDVYGMDGTHLNPGNAFYEYPSDSILERLTAD
jgi:hypothetical protein